MKRLVFLLPREVYSAARSIPVSETASLRAQNAHGASQIAGEVFYRPVARQGLETVILRVNATG